MSEDNLRKNAPEPFVWRGVVAGSWASFIFWFGTNVFLFFRGGAENPVLSVFVVPLLAAIAGGILGGVIGYIVFRWAARSEKIPHALIRMVIGSICVLLYSSSLALRYGEMPINLFELAHALVVGGSAGILARPLKSQWSFRGRPEQALGADSP